MKRFLLLLSAFMLTGTMMARQLTPEEALALAMGKLKAAQPVSTRARATGINATRVSLTHTEMKGQDMPLYYVYDIAEGGFIIASADDSAPALMGSPIVETLLMHSRTRASWHGSRTAARH